MSLPCPKCNQFINDLKVTFEYDEINGSQTICPLCKENMGTMDEYFWMKRVFIFNVMKDAGLIDGNVEDYIDVEMCDKFY